MAYAATVTVDRRGREIRVTISESDAASSSEASIDLGVQKFRVHRQISSLTSGTGTTVDPILGNATSPSGANVILENDTAAATTDNSITGGTTGYVANGTLYHRSQVDAGTNNVIVSIYHLTVGW
tara:strand:- start:1845 stop:2219 length:375 start_codon:yes stop_codon:yes gene_type:complete